MHTLVVCETEPIAIEGLRNLLASAGGFRILSAHHSLPGAAAAARELAPSVLLVDKAFGAGAVVECLQALRESGCRTAAVVWGNALSEVESFRLLQLGAAGVLRKTASLALIVQCLRAVASGDTWMEHDPASAGPHLHVAPRMALTARELQVRELVERGLKNKDIAMALGIRTGTVKIHLKHIFEKTGIRGRYGLALSGLQEKGLLALPEAI